MKNTTIRQAQGFTAHGTGGRRTATASLQAGQFTVATANLRSGRHGRLRIQYNTIQISWQQLVGASNSVANLLALANKQIKLTAKQMNRQRKYGNRASSQYGYGYGSIQITNRRQRQSAAQYGNHATIQYKYGNTIRHVVGQIKYNTIRTNAQSQ